MAATYAVALFAIVFSGCCALTLFATFRHFDPPQPAETPKDEVVTV